MKLVKSIDFISMYDDIYPAGFCDHMILEFDRIFDLGVGTNRQKGEKASKTRKEDDHFDILNIRNHKARPFNGEDSLEILLAGLQDCFVEYSSEFDILKDIPLNCTSAKMQRTPPGGGYHVWHCEQMRSEPERVLVYSIYLNTLEPDAAGETEFLYQKLRIPPKENSLVIWPASYTHTHRGNVVHGNDSKYIVTGWFHLND